MMMTMMMMMMMMMMMNDDDDDDDDGMILIKVIMVMMTGPLEPGVLGVQQHHREKSRDPSSTITCSRGHFFACLSAQRASPLQHPRLEVRTFFIYLFFYHFVLACQHPK